MSDTFPWGREVMLPCPGRPLGWFSEYDTLIPHDAENCHDCNPNLNMSEETAVACLRAGIPVVCDHDTYVAASRRVSAEQQVQAAIKRLAAH